MHRLCKPVEDPTLVAIANNMIVKLQAFEATPDDPEARKELKTQATIFLQDLFSFLANRAKHTSDVPSNDAMPARAAVDHSAERDGAFLSEMQRLRAATQDLSAGVWALHNVGSQASFFPSLARVVS